MEKKSKRQRRQKRCQETMTKPQQMMETVKFYCYRDLYKTCYSLKQNAFFHITVQKKKKKICFTIFRQTNYRQQQKKIKLSHLGMRKLLNQHSRTKLSSFISGVNILVVLCSLCMNSYKKSVSRVCVKGLPVK